MKKPGAPSSVALAEFVRKIQSNYAASAAAYQVNMMLHPVH